MCSCRRFRQRQPALAVSPGDTDGRVRVRFSLVTRAGSTVYRRVLPGRLSHRQASASAFFSRPRSALTFAYCAELHRRGSRPAPPRAIRIRALHSRTGAGLVRPREARVLLADPAFGAVAIGHAHKIAHAPTSSRPEMVHVIVPISTAEFVDTSVLNVISDDGSANSFTAWPCVPVVPMGAYIAGRRRGATGIQLRAEPLSRTIVSTTPCLGWM
jgi:hypothetical protein